MLIFEPTIPAAFPFDADMFLAQLRRLMEAAYENDEAICEAVAAVVPTYHPEAAGEKNAAYEALHKEAVQVN